MLGKLNNDEFAMGSSNETSCFGPVVNPWRRRGSNVGAGAGADRRRASGARRLVRRVGGGSCGTARLGATATDTGGSIRQPAAYTGTVGLKPTYGRCSRWGIVAFASSLDQAGPFARTVRDTAMLMRSMAGHDPKDTTSVDLPVPDYEAALGRSVKGMRIGIPKEYRLDGMPGEIETLWQQGIAWLKDTGAEMVDVSLPHTKYALPAYYIVAPAEASSNLARYDGVRYGLRKDGRDIIGMYEQTRAEGFGAEVRRRVMIGTYVLSAGYYDAYYIRAQKVRTLIKRDFEESFARGIDAMLTPATPSAAFGIGEKGSDPVEMYLNDIFTVTVNMAGLPGIAVPAGSTAKDCRSDCSSSASRSTRRRCSRSARRSRMRRGTMRRSGGGDARVHSQPRCRTPRRPTFWRRPSRPCGGRPRASGIGHIRSSRTMKAARPRGCTRICTGSRATCRTRATGTARQANRLRPACSRRSGKISPSGCLHADLRNGRTVEFHEFSDTLTRSSRRPASGCRYR